MGIHVYYVTPAINGPFKTKMGVVERFNETIKHYLDILMDKRETDDWPSLLPQAEHMYNYEKMNRTVGKTPAQMTKQDEKMFVTRKLRQTHDVQNYWDHVINGRTRVKVLKFDYYADKFRKQGAKFGREVHLTQPNPVGPSLLLRHEQTGESTDWKLVPGNLKYM